MISLHTEYSSRNEVLISYRHSTYNKLSYKWIIHESWKLKKKLQFAMSLMHYIVIYQKYVFQ